MSFSMQEPEPLRLKHDYPPEPAERVLHYGPRKDTTNNVGGAPAFDLAGRKRIALTDGLTADILKQFGITGSTLYRYRKEFRAEREAAGLEVRRGRPPAKELEVSKTYETAEAAMDYADKHYPMEEK